MAIIYPVSMPAGGIRTARFGINANTTVFSSPLSRTQTVLERSGAVWMADYELRPMARADAADWTAFFTSLRGRFGTFEAYDPAATAPRGVATGTPLVAGGGQTGHSLTTDGWTPSIAGILKAGDYLQVGARLHMVVEDAASDDGGAATLSIEPALRESPTDNAAIVIAAPKVRMRLVSDAVGWQQAVSAHYSFSFQAAEVL